MNEYQINAPHSKKMGMKYIKIEIQQYEWKKKKGRTDRTSKMHTLRIDLDSCSTLTPKIIWGQFRDYLSQKNYIL